MYDFKCSLNVFFFKERSFKEKEMQFLKILHPFFKARWFSKIQQT